MRKLIILLYLTLFCGILCLNAQGLQFHGSEKTIADRSSLAIPSVDKDVKNVTEYQLDFDIRNHNIHSPGTIFYLGNRHGKEDFTLNFHYDKSEDKATFIFARNGERTLFSATFPSIDIEEKLMHVCLKLDAASGKMSVAIGNQEKTFVYPGVKGKDIAPQLYFGMGNNIVECASFSIRNIRIIFDGIKTEIPLSERDGEVVHDSNGDKVGNVVNPKWLIIKSFSWQPVWKVYSRTPSGFAFDPFGQNFYSYNSDSLKSYAILPKEESIISLQGDSLPTRLGMNFFNGQTRKIIPYEIYHNALFAEIDPKSGKWKELAMSEPKAVWHHHAHAFRSKDNSLLLFGGYGNREYSGALIRYDLTTHSWDSIPLKGDRITPRFFTSMMMTPSQDTIYLYGGKGNAEGKQDLGIKYYYDFYLIDLKSKIVKKLWEQSPPQVDRVPARTLVRDPDGRHFYAMTYPEYRPHSSLQLYRINMADGSSIAVGDSIPIVSEEIATNVALYNNPMLERIYCVVQEFEKYGENTTTVYSISSPPVSAESVVSDTVEKSDKKRIFIWIACCLGAIIMVCVMLMILRRHGKHKPDNEAGELSESRPQTQSIPQPEPKSQPQSISLQSMPLPESEYPERNCISLFGPFSVRDAAGKDITYMFSRKLKLVFIYILLNTVSRNGVSSSELNSMFWADKEPDKVKNLRNVTLNKLRKSLSEMDGISLLYERGRFRIDLEESCYCDFREVWEISSSLRNTSFNKEQTDKLNSIFLHGNFLTDIEDPAFDYYRQRMEAYIVGYLTEMIEEDFAKGRYDSVNRLCRSLLKVDPLSETALSYSIKSCMASGRTAKARSIYETFSKDFLKTMGEDYTVAFEEFTD